MDELLSPLAYLAGRLRSLPHVEALHAYQSWWEEEGRHISEATDRAGTPNLRMYDSHGARVDEILFAPERRRALMQGYEAGAVWRAFEGSLLPVHHLLYITSFFDPGLSCPYVVSLATALAIHKYGEERLKAACLPRMLRRDSAVWQGATWMTEVKGGSDLGAAVETVARPCGGEWRLTGEKYFASNAGAELAVVAARPEAAPPGVRGLALFLVPRLRQDGSLNYFIRRLKDKIATRSVSTAEIELRDSHAWLLGRAEQGVYLILETLNVSRVANSVGAVALAQRALADAYSFARGRCVFGKPVLDQPLMRAQFDERLRDLEEVFALAWESAGLLDEVWQERPPYSARYWLFRLVAHLAKYWTAEFAAQTAKWAMEVHGGAGAVADFSAERWFREAMVYAIWEGPAHRQILDGIEVMERKHAHRALLEHLGGAPEWIERIEDHLRLGEDRKQAGAEALFRDLAHFTAAALRRRG